MDYGKPLLTPKNAQEKTYASRRRVFKFIFSTDGLYISKGTSYLGVRVFSTEPI